MSQVAVQTAAVRHRMRTGSALRPPAIVGPHCPECGRVPAAGEVWLDDWRSAYVGTLYGDDPPPWCPECSDRVRLGLA
jgi:hypothetical protein